MLLSTLLLLLSIVLGDILRTAHKEAFEDTIIKKELIVDQESMND
jgi:hypothetical protein